ncbi:MAG: hypothetical protein IPJ26_14060 [Bacteroidetes bacterium]|nr:hypothetical protein [Bacteroidota bacterium]
MELDLISTITMDMAEEFQDGLAMCMHLFHPIKIGSGTGIPEQTDLFGVERKSSFTAV